MTIDQAAVDRMVTLMTTDGPSDGRIRAMGRQIVAMIAAGEDGPEVYRMTAQLRRAEME